MYSVYIGFQETYLLEKKQGKIILGWIKGKLQALVMIMDDNDSKNNCSFTVAVMRCFHHGIAQETEHMKGKNTDLYCIPFELLQVINNLSRETS